jgi:hypothetical protein
MVRQIVVDRAGRDWSGAHQRQGRKRLRMVERGYLSDHPADPDAAEVSRRGTERVDKRRRIGGEIAQTVRRCLRVEGRRRSAVAQVIADHPPATRREPLTHRVRPRQHRGPASQQHERIGIAAKGLDAEFDAVRPH